MNNILSIDLEDWHQLVQRAITGAMPAPSLNVQGQVDELLDLLYHHHTKATFFVLGTIADAFPDVVRRLAAQGHEIASHGHQHLQVFRLSRREFYDDTLRARDTLQNITGKKVEGYRAAAFSITRDSLWALEVLAELGFRYDSSIFPVHHRRYGIPEFDPRPMRYDLSNGATLIEVPPSAVRMAGALLPIAGGGYFRLLPGSVLRRGVRQLNSEDRPLVTYFHPYEFDSRRLDIFQTFRPAGWKQRLRGVHLNLHYNLLRGTLVPKLAALLQEFRFVTFREFLDAAELGPSQRLLSSSRG